MVELDVAPVAVHASYLVNLAGPDPGFRASSIDVLASDMAAARGLRRAGSSTSTPARTGTTSVEAGIERVASAVAEVLRQARRVGGDRTGRTDARPRERGGRRLVRRDDDRGARAHRRSGGRRWASRSTGWASASTSRTPGAPASAMDDPDAIDAWLEAFDRSLGLGRLAMIHFNDSRSERGSRTDRHEHVGAGRIGPRGLAHLLRHPRAAARCRSCSRRRAWTRATTRSTSIAAGRSSPASPSPGCPRPRSTCHAARRPPRRPTTTSRSPGPGARPRARRPR